MSIQWSNPKSKEVAVQAVRLMINSQDMGACLEAYAALTVMMARILAPSYEVDSSTLVGAIMRDMIDKLSAHDVGQWIEQARKSTVPGADRSGRW